MEIAYKVSLWLPRREDWCKLNPEGDLCLVHLSDSKKASPDTISHNNRFLISRYKEIIFEKVVIKNSGFSLELLDYDMYGDKNHSLFRCRLFGTTYSAAIKVNHPELSEFPIPIIIFVPYEDIIKIISRTGYMSERILSGRYCSLKIKGTTQANAFDVENPENQDQQDKKELGKKLAEEKKTSKWIPGHKYLLTTGNQVLYLGIIKDFLNIENIRYKNGCPLIFSFDDYNLDILEGKSDVHLFLNLSMLCRDEESFLESQEGAQTDSFVFFYLPFIQNNNITSNLRFYTGKPKLGIDCGEYLREGLPILIENLITYFSKLYDSTHKREITSLVDPDLLSESGQEYYKTDASSSITSSLRYVDSSYKTTVDKYIGFIRTHTGSRYYIYKGRNLLNCIGEAKFKKYLRWRF